MIKVVVETQFWEVWINYRTSYDFSKLKCKTWFSALFLKEAGNFEKL